MAMNIILLKGASQYDALRIFVDALANGFKSLGHRATVIDMLSDGAIDSLNKVVSKEFDFIINLNGIFNEDPGFANFINNVNAVVVSIFVDHPYYQRNRVATTIKRNIQTFVCESHLDAANIIAGENGDRLFYFLPHGGLMNDDFKLKRSDFIKRKNKVLYIGSCYNQSLSTPWDSMSNHQHALLSKAIYDGLVNGLSYEESFNVSLKYLKCHPQDEISKKLYMSMFDVYFYFRAKNRFETIEAMLKDGIEIDCYGSGDWNEMFGKYKNFSYFGMLSMHESLKKIQEYKFTLNDVCFFPYGSHERTFNAMLNGSVIINYNSHYYKEVFNDREGIFFDAQSLSEVITRVKSLMGNHDEAFSIANNGYTAAQKHTWKDRAKQIADIYSLYVKC